jgi:hypothetical protein
MKIDDGKRERKTRVVEVQTEPEIADQEGAVFTKGNA